MHENRDAILYVGGFELPDKNAAAHRVLNNAKIFRELGFRVIFCGIDQNIEQPILEACVVSGFESYPLPYPKTVKQWIRQMSNIDRYIALIRQNADVKAVVAYNLHALVLAKLLKFCHRRKIKVIADCTEWYPNAFSLNPVKFIKWLDTLLCMRHYQKKCDGMIAISRFLEGYYKKYTSDIIVVPPLVDLEDEPYKSLPRKEASDKIRFVYCGSPAVAKESLGEVVSCFNTLNETNFIFRIVGITREQFVSIYHIEPDDKKICFEGRVSHIEALNIVRQSDYSIIIRPDNRTTKAGFPTKFAEAISCGTAVIANHNSDLAEYLKDGKNGYLIDEKDLLNEFKKIIQRNTLSEIQRDLFDYHLWSEPFRILLCNLNLI